MELLKLDDFLMYNFLSSVQMNPDGNGVAYLASSADGENNSYSADLYYARRPSSGSASIRLTQSGKVKSYAWVDGTRLLYTQQDAPCAEAPYGRTRVYSTEIYGDQFTECFALEGAMTLVGILEDGRPVFTRVDNLVHQKALEGLEGDAYLAKAAELKAEGVGVLDYVFVTHGDSDHMNAVEELLDRQETGVKVSCSSRCSCP